MDLRALESLILLVVPPGVLWAAQCRRFPGAQGGGASSVGGERMQRHPVVTMICGSALFAWVPFRRAICALGLMRISGDHPSIGTFFLPTGLADILTVVGIGVMVYAFIQIANRK